MSRARPGATPPSEDGQRDDRLTGQPASDGRSHGDTGGNARVGATGSVPGAARSAESPPGDPSEIAATVPHPSDGVRSEATCTFGKQGATDGRRGAGRSDAVRLPTRGNLRRGDAPEGIRAAIRTPPSGGARSAPVQPGEPQIRHRLQHAENRGAEKAVEVVRNHEDGTRTVSWQPRPKGLGDEVREWTPAVKSEEGQPAKDESHERNEGARSERSSRASGSVRGAPEARQGARRCVEDPERGRDTRPEWKKPAELPPATVKSRAGAAKANRAASTGGGRETFATSSTRRTSWALPRRQRRALEPCENL